MPVSVGREYTALIRHPVNFLTSPSRFERQKVNAGVTANDPPARSCAGKCARARGKRQRQLGEPWRRARRTLPAAEFARTGVRRVGRGFRFLQQLAAGGNVPGVERTGPMGERHKKPPSICPQGRKRGAVVGSNPTRIKRRLRGRPVAQSGLEHANGETQVRILSVVAFGARR